MFEEGGQLEDSDLALFVSDGQMLPLVAAAAVAGSQAAHDDTPNYVRSQQLSDRLSLVASVIHTHIFEGT